MINDNYDLIIQFIFTEMEVSKKALLLLNMGGPRSIEEVEVFLKNMFNDPRILTMPSFFRKMVGGMIVKGRKSEAIKNYEILGGKSPIVAHTEKLVEKLSRYLQNSDIDVFYVMRYTPPFAYDILKELQKKGVEEIFLLPLYPHFSTTTTASSFDDIDASLKELNYSPKIKRITSFYDHIGYNLSVIEKIKEAIAGKDPKEFDLIFSAHGLPQKMVDAGDPYQTQIETNVEILKDLLEKANIIFKNIHLAYQSKVGPLKWLTPSLGEKLKEIENKKVVIYPISFTLDNSETDFELSIEYRKEALDLGFKEYIVARCVNDSDLFVKSLVDIYKNM